MRSFVFNSTHQDFTIQHAKTQCILCYRQLASRWSKPTSSLCPFLRAHWRNGWSGPIISAPHYWKGNHAITAPFAIRTPGKVSRSLNACTGTVYTLWYTSSLKCVQDLFGASLCSTSRVAWWHHKVAGKCESTADVNSLWQLVTGHCVIGHRYTITRFFLSALMVMFKMDVICKKKKNEGVLFISPVRCWV